MKKILIYISIIVFAIGGCKKVDLDEVPSGDPVFTADATFGNGTQLNLVAGDDDFYMFSEFSKDDLDVYTMIGRFAKDANCQVDCEESLSFSIRSSFVDSLPNLPFEINSALAVGSDFNYYVDDVISTQNGFHYELNAQLSDSFNVSAESFNWVINGQPFSGQFIDFDYLDSFDLNVRLEVVTSDSCVSYFEKILPVGIIDDCDLNIDVNPINNFPGFDLLPSFNSQNGGNTNFDWTPQSPLGDTFRIDSFFQIPADNIISLSASNNDNGCLVNLGVCLGSDMGSGIPSSFALSSFDYFVDTVIVVTSGTNKQLSAVTIEYQDETGIYSSEFANNSDTLANTFTIIEIENYEDNGNGEKTKKLTIAYDCILQKQGSGETKNISGTAEIAVAYPD